MVNPPTRGNFFIGNGVIVNDKFSATGEIIIDSQMSREITADKISFGKTGMLTASAVAKHVDVFGEVTKRLLPIFL